MDVEEITQLDQLLEGIERIQVCESISWEPLDEIEEAWIILGIYTSVVVIGKAIEDIEA